MAIIPFSTTTTTNGTVSTVTSTSVGGASVITSIVNSVRNDVSAVFNYISEVKDALSSAPTAASTMKSAIGNNSTQNGVMPGGLSPVIGTNPTPEAIQTPYTKISYPTDSLGSDRYPYYTIFYINDMGKSSEYIGETTDAAIARQQVNTAGVSSSKVAGGAISTVLAGAAKTLDILPGTEQTVSALNSASQTAAAWGIPAKRLKTCISLPMPQKVRANYNAGYSETEAQAAFGAVISDVLSGKGVDGMEALALGAAPVAVGLVAAGAHSLADKAGLGGALPSPEIAQKTAAQIASKLSGRVFNRRQEQLFTNMEFRHHEMSWLFIPRNVDESINIMSIIQTFKTYMHPDLANGIGSSLLIVPAEFDIDFMWINDRNVAIPRIATCALLSLDVNYTAIGEFVAFKDTPHPVAIQLDLVFRELEPLNRTMIAGGF